MAGSGIAGIDTPELRESYELCVRVGQRRLGSFWTAMELLPPAARAYVSAVSGFAVWTDALADDSNPADRAHLLAQWCAATMVEVRAEASDHPLRRAFVHTTRQCGLDIRFLEAYLEATRADSAAPPAFATVTDQRRYLRGVAGNLGELITPILKPCNGEAGRLMALLCEAFQLADILHDFSSDFAAGRFYLPAEDLDRLGLTVEDLRSGVPSGALEELIGVQVTRGRDLLGQAVPVAGMVTVACQPFLHGMILGIEAIFDEAERLGARVLTEGIDVEGMAEASLPPRRELPAQLVVPGHVAVIMDGNRRWAVQRGLSAQDGHSAGLRAALRLAVSAFELGVRHLSVYGFSTENWSRSPQELATLFEMAAEGLTRGAQRLQQHGVRVRWCGRRDRLDENLASVLAIVENMTSNNTALTLNIFAGYGGREELVTAARALAVEAVAGTIRPEDIAAQDLARHCYAADLPDVDLLIRTSGEQRTSNFLPWHLAYAEFVFDPTYWPDFGYRHLLAAITEYSGRHRRFGGDDGRERHPEATATAR